MRIRALPRRGRNVLFALMALLVATVANLQALPAQAAQIEAIDPNSITLTNESRPGQKIYQHDTAQIHATWSMPAGGQAGDTFSLGLPPVLQSLGGNFELKGTGAQSDVVFGTCQVEGTQVTCTLSDAVTGKSNVGGDLWVRVRANQTYTGSTLTFTINDSTTKEVPLPEGADGIGYDPWLPSEYLKLGYFNGDVLVWRVVIPGNKIAGLNSLSINDVYAVEGTNFTLESATFYKIPKTSECWNNSTDPTCRTAMWDTTGTNTGGINFDVDNDRDAISGTVSGPFDADAIYTLHLRLTTDFPIYPGSEFPNTAMVNGEAVEQIATREATGGGTGAGDTVGHIEVVKKVSGGDVPDDTVFPLKYSYSQGGKDYSGTLEVKADGTPAVLRNVLDGTQVTLTEELPTVANTNFGDPVFSGDGVADGGADSKSATVTVVGTKRLAVVLTNPVQETPKVVPVSPAIKAGVCSAGSVTPSDPTVTKPVTEGITYSDPVLTPQAGSNVVKVTMTATADSGKRIDADNLPDGWTMNQDGTATFNGEVTQPECEPTVVVPVSPVITLGVCAPGATQPTDPKVEFPATEGITYSEETQNVENGKLTVTRKATPNAGYKLGDLPEGWTLNSDGSASFEAVKDQPKCDTPVVPAVPKVAPGVCKAGSTTPTDPTVTLSSTEGVEYGSPEITSEGSKATVKVVATAKDGFVIKRDALPEGWTLSDDAKTATFVKVVDQPKCDTPVVPVSPTINAGVCKAGSTTPSEPTVDVPSTANVVYEGLDVKVENATVKVALTAKAAAGYKFDTSALPEGWTSADGFTATYSGEVKQPKCDTPVVPVLPKVAPGVCKAGSTTPTDPTVTLSSTEGVEYGSPEITSEGSKATVKVVATAKDGFVFKRDALPEGWTLSDDAKTATFVKVVDQPKCDTPVVPVSPTINAGVCKAGSTTPSEPTVDVPSTANVVYEGLDVKVENATVKVALTAKAAAGYKFDTSALPVGWTSADGFTATYSGEVKQPSCEEPVVVPVGPMVDPGVCKPGATTPTEPKVSMPTTAGVTYGKPQVKVDSGLVKVTVTATPAKGKKFDKASLPSGWTLNSDGTATYSGEVKQPSCVVPVTPVDPGIVPGVCRPGSESPTPPTVTTPRVPGLVYGKPKITENNGKVSITVTVTPEAGRKIGGLKGGWTLNADGTATYTYVGKTPACVKPGLPKTGD